MPSLKLTEPIMARCFRILVTILAVVIPLEAYCCTSVIISGKARTDGRPVMLKHRDTGELNNLIQWFRGPKYDFIGLVNSSSKVGEVWSGHNSAGFCIMNTATYDLKNDDVPSSEMDQEGVLMYKALGECGNVADFEKMLEYLPKPWGVEANFGIIDSEGEAVYYEINNYSFKKYDVSQEPGGYMVVTNFTRSGRPEERKGVDRFEKASLIMEGLEVAEVSHIELFNAISRSGKPIVRDISASAMVFEGVAPGEDPDLTVAWTILGCPTTCVYIPVKVFNSDHIPSYMKNKKGSEEAQICSQSLVIKGIYGYEKGCSQECAQVEKFIDNRFKKSISASGYDRFARKVYRKYKMLYLRKLPKVVS